MAVKYFDKNTLIDAAEISVERGYNRTVDPHWLENELDAEFVFPISFAMLHEHAQGVLVDPHMRVIAVLDGSGETVMLDVDMGIYMALPEVELKV